MLRFFFIIIFSSLSLISLAQSYKYDVEQLGEELEGFWETKLSEVCFISEHQLISFDIIAKKGKTAGLGFYLFDNEADEVFYSALIEENKTGTAQIHLSNGEILTTQAMRGGFWFHIYEHKLQSSRRGNLGKPGSAMTLLRKYNITKIVVQGHDFLTPNFQSAATIDAMCRDLVKIIGDDGQLGTAPNYLPSGRNENVNKSVSSPSSTQPSPKANLHNNRPATTTTATKAQTATTTSTTTVKPSSTSTTTVKPSSTNTTAVKPSTTSTTSAAATNNSELTTVTFKQMVTQMLTNAKQYQNYRIDSVSSNPSGSFTYNFFHRSQDDAGIIILQLVADAEAMGIKLKHYKDKLGEGYYGSYNGYTIYIHSSKESKYGGLYRNVKLIVKPAGAIF